MNKIRVLVLALFLSFFLVGCDGDSTITSGTTTATNTTTTTTVVIQEDTYTLNIFRPGDSTITINDIEFGERIRLNDLGKPGYTFIGFDYNGLILNNPFDYNYTEDISITAIYEQNVHTVEFRDFDDTVLSVVTVMDGSNLLNPSNPTREGYTFIGWNMDLTNITSDLIVTAVYEKNIYNVIFQDEDGTLLCFSPTEYLDSPAEPEQVPTKLGFSWGGWDKDYSSITSDLIITATYIPMEYTITFNSNGGDIVNQLTVYYGDVLDLSTIVTTKADNNFLGWSLDGLEPTGMYTVTEDITFEALWEDSMSDFVYDEVSGNIHILEYTGDKEIVIIPDTYGEFDITHIEDYAFAYNSTLRVIEIGKNVTTIGDFAFRYCGNLEHVVLAEDTMLNYLGSYAFYDCLSLESINLEAVKGTLMINQRVFTNCIHLRYIYIPELTTLIDAYAFVGCENLTIFINRFADDGLWHVDWNPDNLPVERRTTDYGVYNDLIYEIDELFGVVILGLVEGSNITDLVIPNEIMGEPVTYIYIGAFNSSKLVNVFIPNTMSSILDGAFENSLSLETVYFENGSYLHEIESDAFKNCISLTSINIENCPELDSIGSEAFMNTDLFEIYIDLNVYSIGENAFFGINDLTIYCEAISAPSGWHIDWNPDNHRVFWNYYKL